MIHKRASFYLASLDSMWSKYKQQTRYTISTDVRNSTEANLQIKSSNLQIRNKTTESCEVVQNKTIKSKSGKAEFTKSKSIRKLKIRRI